MFEVIFTRLGHGGIVSLAGWYANTPVAMGVLNLSQSGNVWLGASTNPCDRVLERSRGKGLQQDIDILGPVADRVGFRISRDDQCGHLGANSSGASHKFRSRQMRHGIIADQEVALTSSVVQSGQRFAAVGRFNHCMSEFLKKGGRSSPYFRMVIHEQDRKRSYL